MSQQLRIYALPLAMVVGALFSGFFALLDPATPSLIFVMLFITFCRITPSDMKYSPMLLWLLLAQVGGGAAIYLLLTGFGEVAAQGVAVCVFAPAAVSSVVFAGMLGANIALVASFTLVSNLAVSVFAPLAFALVGEHSGMPFIDSFLMILARVGPLLVVPIAAAFLLRVVSPRAHAYVGRHQAVSFYLWAVSLMIVTGRTVEFVRAKDPEHYTLGAIIAAGALVVCLAQFIVGRYVGGRYGDKTAGGQSLGQKNTVMAIWMAQNFLDPVASVGPAAYVLWQNIVNSWQLWRSKRVARGPRTN